MASTACLFAVGTTTLLKGFGLKVTGVERPPRN